MRFSGRQSFQVCLPVFAKLRWRGAPAERAHPCCSVSWNILCLFTLCHFQTSDVNNKDFFVFHTISYSLPSEVQSQNTVEFYPPHTFLLDGFFQLFLFIVPGKLLIFWLKNALFIFSWLFSPWNGLKLYCLVAISNIILVVIMHIFDNRNNLSSWRIQIALKY